MDCALTCPCVDSWLIGPPTTLYYTVLRVLEIRRGPPCLCATMGERAQDEDHLLANNFKYVLASSLAGICARVATHPFDTFKTLQQSEQGYLSPTPIQSLAYSNGFTTLLLLLLSSSSSVVPRVLGIVTECLFASC